MLHILLILVANFGLNLAYEPGDFISFNDLRFFPVNWNDDEISFVIKGEEVSFSYKEIHFNFSRQQIYQHKFFMLESENQTLVVVGEEEVTFVDAKTKKSTSRPKAKPGKLAPSIKQEILYRFEDKTATAKTQITLLAPEDKDGKEPSDMKGFIVNIAKNTIWLYSFSFAWAKKLYLVFRFGAEQGILIRVDEDRPWDQAISAVKLFSISFYIAFLPDAEEPSLLQSTSGHKGTGLIVYPLKFLDQSLEGISDLCYGHPPSVSPVQQSEFIELDEYLENRTAIQGCRRPGAKPLLFIQSLGSNFVVKSTLEKIGAFTWYRLGHDVNRTVFIYVMNGDLKVCEIKSSGAENITGCENIKGAENIDRFSLNFHTVDSRTGHLVIPDKIDSPTPRRIPLYRCQDLPSCESCETFGAYRNCLWNVKTKKCSHEAGKNDPVPGLCFSISSISLNKMDDKNFDLSLYISYEPVVGDKVFVVVDETRHGPLGLVGSTLKVRLDKESYWSLTVEILRSTGKPMIAVHKTSSDMLYFILIPLGFLAVAIPTYHRRRMMLKGSEPRSESKTSPVDLSISLMSDDKVQVSTGSRAQTSLALGKGKSLISPLPKFQKAKPVQKSRLDTGKKSQFVVPARRKPSYPV